MTSPFLYVYVLTFSTFLRVENGQQLDRRDRGEADRAVEAA